MAERFGEKHIIVNRRLHSGEVTRVLLPLVGMVVHDLKGQICPCQITYICSDTDEYFNVMDTFAEIITVLKEQ